MSEKIVDLRANNKTNNTNTNNPNLADIEREKRKKAAKDNRARKRKWLDVVLAFANSELAKQLKSVKDTAEKQKLMDVQEAAKMLTTGTRASGLGVTGTKDDFYASFNALNVGQALSEEEIFSRYKIARHGMSRIIRDFIKNYDPSERLWVRLDPEKGYVLVAKGADVPVGWTGYRPINIQPVELG